MKHNNIKLNEILLAVERFKEAAANANTERAMTNKAFATGAIEAAIGYAESNNYQRWSDFRAAYAAGYKWGLEKSGYFFGYFLPAGER